MILSFLFSLIFINPQKLYIESPWVKLNLFAFLGLFIGSIIITNTSYLFTENLFENIVIFVLGLYYYLQREKVVPPVFKGQIVNLLILFALPFSQIKLFLALGLMINQSAEKIRVMLITLVIMMAASLNYESNYLGIGIMTLTIACSTIIAFKKSVSHIVIMLIVSFSSFSIGAISGNQLSALVCILFLLIAYKFFKVKIETRLTSLQKLGFYMENRF